MNLGFDGMTIKHYKDYKEGQFLKDIKIED